MTMTPRQENIEQQQERLRTERATLANLLMQQAKLGSAYAPPGVLGSIGEARAAIRHIKKTLDNWGVAVEDHPDDEEETIPGMSRAQILLERMPLDHIPDVAPLPSGSRMPFSFNPLFVGRTADLTTLATTFKGDMTTAIVRIAAVTGLGGIGKTQLASEFVHRYGQFLIGVFWLSFADPARVPEEVASCGGAGMMNLHGFANLSLDEQVMRVLQEWQTPIPRLLIFDNCEDEALLDRWRPKTGGCRVLVTSRRAQWDLILGITEIPLDVLSRDDSIALLKKFRPDLSGDEGDLDAIADELGDLPLALHLAGSFLARYKNAITPVEYLNKVRSPEFLEHLHLLSQRAGQSVTGHVQDVGRTFAMSCDALDDDDDTDRMALAALACAAYFAPGEPIPSDILQTVFGLPDEDDPNIAIQYENALTRLVELGYWSVARPIRFGSIDC